MRRRTLSHTKMDTTPPTRALKSRCDALDDGDGASVRSWLRNIETRSISEEEQSRLGWILITTTTPLQFFLMCLN